MLDLFARFGGKKGAYPKRIRIVNAKKSFIGYLIVVFLLCLRIEKWDFREWCTMNRRRRLFMLDIFGLKLMSLFMSIYFWSIVCIDIY